MSQKAAAAAKKLSKTQISAKKPPAKKAKTDAIVVPKTVVELINTKEGKQVPFLALCKVLEFIEATTKRLEITALTRDLLLQVMQVGQQQLTPTVMLCINKVAPDHEGIELGIGESILMKAIASATGRQIAKVKQDRQELGDLGMVVQQGKTNQRTMFKPQPLSISKVFNSFKEIALTSGSSSIQKKTGLITGLLAACSDIEAKYLIRSLEGRLRIGLAESTVQVALAQAALIYERGDKGEPEAEEFQQASENLKQVLSEFPIYANVIESIYEHGISDVANHCMLTPTLPVKPMLAKIEKAADDILRRFEGKPFTCEYKYDGERSQIHYVRKDDGSEECVIFSRNAENNTGKYPDIARSVKEFAKPSVTSFILDCEAVAWDLVTGKIRSFQTLSSRKKKVADESEITVGVCCFAFDLLFLNDEPLIRMPLRKRRELMREHFSAVPNKFQFAISKDLTEVEDIQGFLEQSITDNCEGLMIKSLDGDSSSYEPSKRSMNWLKLKKDYVDGLGDSLDLVVIGAYYGKGKRVGAYGSFLLACYDPDREEYQSICNIGTGFSDAALESHKAQLDLNKIESPKPYYTVSDKTKPDIWFEPIQVWEVKAADLSLSSVYQAAYGEVNADKGVSLRFPRFIRVRDDKSPEMATSSTQIAEMYENQKINH
ncbi:ATP-dependent DNA ligase [Coemansia reversa NRRL 1564]|uniref:DNA ligase 1 n=1 Tax=Coemansia reversa (strain ATCC 12441 / NRRL 1564) TaxID=763665 RepID=A0A2G5BFZ2_COERN|nr:ATP-dependent DNA ligase [Coemansia reversa NRRL 1564]|eukprot:PIA17920.1 ATP-dependent DNA ligase [Coemansia reversa NRRL 1564]